MAIGGYLIYQKLGDVISSNWLGKTSLPASFRGLRPLVLFPAIPPWATGLISFAWPSLWPPCAIIFQYRKALKKKNRRDSYAVHNFS